MFTLRKKKHQLVNFIITSTSAAIVETSCKWFLELCFKKMLNLDKRENEKTNAIKGKFARGFS